MLIPRTGARERPRDRPSLAPSLFYRSIDVTGVDMAKAATCIVWLSAIITAAQATAKLMAESPSTIDIIKKISRASANTIFAMAPTPSCGSNAIILFQIAGLGNCSLAFATHTKVWVGPTPKVAHPASSAGSLLGSAE
jgi:hypothetical protein